MKINISNIWIVLSVIVSFIVGFTSLLGIFYPPTYSQETLSWAVQAIGQDIGNLIVIPILLISTYFLSKKSIKAYFIWLGCFFYLVYAFIIYTFTVHFNFLFLAYVSVLGISFYSIVGTLIKINISEYAPIFKDISFSKISSFFLMFIGLIFGFLWLSDIIPALINNQIPKSIADTGLWINPVHVIDLSILLPAMIISSVLSFRKKIIGFFFTIPLLVFSFTMGIGIISLLIVSIYKGLSQFSPVLIFMSFIVLLSLIFSYIFTKNIKTK